MTDAAQSEVPLAQPFGAAGLRSVAVIPLIEDKRLFGLLVLARRAAGAFSASEEAFLRTLGAPVAIATAQAHLYSELQHAYTELQHGQQAATQGERLRALGQMASGIAHDINNNLSPIVTYADILLTRETGRLDPDTREYLTNIQAAGEDIGATVERLSDRRDLGRVVQTARIGRRMRQGVAMPGGRRSFADDAGSLANSPRPAPGAATPVADHVGGASPGCPGTSERRQ